LLLLLLCPLRGHRLLAALFLLLPLPLLPRIQQTHAPQDRVDRPLSLVRRRKPAREAVRASAAAAAAGQRLEPRGRNGVLLLLLFLVAVTTPLPIQTLKGTSSRQVLWPRLEEGEHVVRVAAAASGVALALAPARCGRAERRLALGGALFALSTLADLLARLNLLGRVVWVFVGRVRGVRAGVGGVGGGWRVGVVGGGRCRRCCRRHHGLAAGADCADKRRGQAARDDVLLLDGRDPQGH